MRMRRDTIFDPHQSTEPAFCSLRENTSDISARTCGARNSREQRYAPSHLGKFEPRTVSKDPMALRTIGPKTILKVLILASASYHVGEAAGKYRESVSREGPEAMRRCHACWRRAGTTVELSRRIHQYRHRQNAKAKERSWRSSSQSGSPAQRRAHSTAGDIIAPHTAPCFLRARQVAVSASIVSTHRPVALAETRLSRRARRDMEQLIVGASSVGTEH